MKRYDRDDITTFWIVIYDNKDKNIVAWTDEKILLKVYLDFHKCKYFKIKEIKDKAYNLFKIRDENNQEEIEIMNISTFIKHKRVDIKVPMTSREKKNLEDELVTFGMVGLNINYSMLNNYIPFLKKKYRVALNDVLLVPIMNKVIHENNSKISLKMKMDELKMLIKISNHYSDGYFGE